MMKRPRTLNEGSRRVLAGDDEFSPSLLEFLDTFYLSDDENRAISLCDQPLLIDPVAFRRRLLFVSANALDRASMHSSNAFPNSRQK